MKKLCKWMLVICCCVFALGALAASAADTVYVKDGGKGDGSSAKNPVGSLQAAYDALDLSKDCTVVICGKFTQSANFTRTASYTGSVTLTSVYGGTDYRESGAVYEFKPGRFYLWGETTFENMNFHALGTNLLVVAQHNKVTVGKGVKITGDKMTGGTIATSFAIIGGYQDEASTATNTLDTDITVLSGSKIYIVAFARGRSGGANADSRKGPQTYTGTANIKIGGNASVARLHLTGVDRNNITYGTTKVEITGDAEVRYIYGTTQNITANAFKVTWRSGTIGKYEPVCSATPGKILTVTNGTVLAATDKAKQNANFATVAAQFDRVEDLGGGTGEKVGTLTTVYLADGGTGDGKTPASQIGRASCRERV